MAVFFFYLFIVMFINFKYKFVNLYIMFIKFINFRKTDSNTTFIFQLMIPTTIYKISGFILLFPWFTGKPQ